MKKYLITLMLALSASAFISCSSANSDQTNIPNKYPIEEYISRGGELVKYLPDGTALLKDSEGLQFFVGESSTYKSLLTDDGILMPIIVINNNTYYYDFVNTSDSLPDGFKKAKILFFNGNTEKLSGEKDIYEFTKSVTAYESSNNPNNIYLKINGQDKYQLWKTSDSL